MAKCWQRLQGASSSSSKTIGSDSVEKVCGVDAHRDLLVATILSDEAKEHKRFVDDPDDVDKLKDWLKAHECKLAVMESTSVYRVPLHLALEESAFEVSLANAHQVKAIPGRKTDQSSSEWLAHLLLGGQIKPSYVPDKRLRELRELTRLRVKYVQNRTAFENSCQRVLNRVSEHLLRSKLSEVFGMAGMEILNGLMAGEIVENILKHTESN
jgi:transposase